jgi:phage protein U
MLPIGTSNKWYLFHGSGHQQGQYVIPNIIRYKKIIWI